jgi:hypothetical protein
MIQSSEDLESYLARLERPFERVDEGTYVVPMGPSRVLVALRIQAPVLVIRAEIGRVPAAPAASQALFRRLLELNQSSLLYAAYGLEQDRIVLSAALTLESVDLNELEATLADVDLALSGHVSTLHEMVRS